MGHAPRRTVIPRAESRRRPFCGLVRMADVAGIGDLQSLGLGRRHKAKGVAADIDVGNRLLDGRHMASYATATGTSGGVMRCCSTVGARGPACALGPWQPKQRLFPVSRTIPGLSLP
jgi:hypothetical protein